MRWFFAARRLTEGGDEHLCPLPSELPLPQAARVQVFAPHSDDEVLGCGGTLALLAERGCAIQVVLITDSNTVDTRNPSVGQERLEESKRALEVLGVPAPVCLGETDGGLRRTNSLAARLKALITEFRPQLLFFPSALDGHRDHFVASELLVDCWRACGSSGRVFLYEGWSPLPASCVVDISTVIEKKKRALECYRIPLQYKDYLRASVGLAAYRGLILRGPRRDASAEAFLEIKAGRDGSDVFSSLLKLRRQIEPDWSP